MSKRVWGLILLFIGSEILGVASGHLFFGIFKDTVPPALVTEFNKTTAYGAFLLYGAALGVLIMVWSLIVVVLAKIFRPSAAATAPTPRT